MFLSIDCSLATFLKFLTWYNGFSNSLPMASFAVNELDFNVLNMGVHIPFSPNHPNPVFAIFSISSHSSSEKVVRILAAPIDPSRNGLSGLIVLVAIGETSCAALFTASSSKSILSALLSKSLNIFFASGLVLAIPGNMAGKTKPPPVINILSVNVLALSNFLLIISSPPRAIPTLLLRASLLPVKKNFPTLENISSAVGSVNPPSILPVM